MIARLTYRPSIVLGGARRLYSVVFLFGVFSFYELGSIQAAVLVCFWGVFIALWPLGVPEILGIIRPLKRSFLPVGKVVRTDWPNLVRCELRSDANWARENFKIYRQADGKQRLVLPLYSQVQEQTLLGTGLCVADVAEPVPELQSGYVYDGGSTERGTD